MNIYLALALVTVTIHISVPIPSAHNPKYYGLDTCTGVFISPNEIITADHCVEHSRGHQWIKTSDDKTYGAILIKKDKNRDLALLKVNTNHKYTKLAKDVYKCERVYTVNSGMDLEQTYSEGIVNNFIHDPDNDSWSILHSALMLSGASGSGLFNSHKELVGINIAVLGRFSEAVDLMEIETFLKR